MQIGKREVRSIHVLFLRLDIYFQVSLGLLSVLEVRAGNIISKATSKNTFQIKMNSWTDDVNVRGNKCL